VRTLLDGVESSGASQIQVSWDGRDDAGRDVGSGVYFCELRTRDGAAGQRLVRIR
jgi:hypothetical protein